MNSDHTRLQTSIDHTAKAAEAADIIFRALLRSARAAGMSKARAAQCAGLAAAISTGFDMLAALGLVAGRQQASKIVDDDHVAGDLIAPKDDGVAAFLDAWRSGNIPVPFTVCRSSDLYQAYLLWARSSGRQDYPCRITKFFGYVKQAMPEIERVTSKVNERNARLIVMRSTRRDAIEGTWIEYAANEATRFRSALLEWDITPETGATSQTGGRG